MLVPENEQLPTTEKAKFEKINSYIHNAKSKNTQKSYAADWKHFTEWCKVNNRNPLPASAGTLCLYLSDLAETHKYSTLRRRVSSINMAHKFKKHLPPSQHIEVQALMEGIKRENGTQHEPKRALMLQFIPELMNKIDTSTLIGIRDKAILLLGFALASRRSELVAINIEDLDVNDFGMDVRIQDTKTKQDDLIKAVVFTQNEFCPVKATQEWIKGGGITSGALFRAIDRHGNVKDRLSDQSISLILKKYIGELGLDVNDFAGHSLRSGLSTSAAMMGMTEIAIMKQTGHKSREMVDRYVQAGLRYRNNASSILKEL
ncbi:site-specific integrase [Mesobacillus foraminis]|uniref:Site-specific recombinase XerD n=1 Tax=Mesobacillus foraminis TaxID=279826 RepID=A0A4R2B3T8_9BACI|nr:site-specific integrase [Mesobacillus foraminis]TCN21221.1 site-specific recombinase XerD [Mesobacillus foraminis]